MYVIIDTRSENSDDSQLKSVRYQYTESGHTRINAVSLTSITGIWYYSTSLFPLYPLLPAK
jgi:hypothetical protein